MIYLQGHSVSVLKQNTQFLCAPGLLFVLVVLCFVVVVVVGGLCVCVVVILGFFWCVY